MNTSLFVESSLILTPQDILQDRHLGHIDIDCWLEDAADPPVALVSVAGAEPQSIDLEWIGITFGERAYFICRCGYRAAKLYLPPGKTEFRCRSCYQLRYELSAINRRSAQGQLPYRTNRIIRLTNQRAGMNRIIYKNRYTKKYERFLKLAGQAGFDGMVREARDFMTAIRS